MKIGWKRVLKHFDRNIFGWDVHFYGQVDCWYMEDLQKTETEDVRHVAVMRTRTSGRWVHESDWSILAGLPSNHIAHALT